MVDLSNPALKPFLDFRQTALKAVTNLNNAFAQGGINVARSGRDLAAHQQNLINVNTRLMERGVVFENQNLIDSTRNQLDSLKSRLDEELRASKGAATLSITELQRDISRTDKDFRGLLLQSDIVDVSSQPDFAEILPSNPQQSSSSSVNGNVLLLAGLVLLAI